MIRRTSHSRRRLALASTALAMAVCGCSAMPSFGNGAASTQQASETPPRVQDCGIVSISSPTRYACNGKVYTSFELVKLRSGEIVGGKVGPHATRE